MSRCSCASRVFLKRLCRRVSYSITVPSSLVIIRPCLVLSCVCGVCSSSGKPSCRYCMCCSSEVVWSCSSEVVWPCSSEVVWPCSSGVVVPCSSEVQKFVPQKWWWCLVAQKWCGLVAQKWWWCPVAQKWWGW